MSQFSLRKLAMTLLEEHLNRDIEFSQVYEDERTKGLNEQELKDVHAYMSTCNVRVNLPDLIAHNSDCAVGEMWEERSRPGHTVRITKLENARWHPNPVMVYYKHVGTHNIRTQSMETVSAITNFVKNYKRIVS